MRKENGVDRMKTNIQLERQAVNHRGILDFTIDRIPELPQKVLSRFPELRQTLDAVERLRINLQLQLREQFVALRNVLDKAAPVEQVEEIRNFLTREIKTIQKEITVINTVEQAGASTTPIASSELSGTVKTDRTVADPVVYLTETVDELLATVRADAAGPILNILNNLNQLTTEFNELVTEQATQYVFTVLTPTNPLILPHGRSVHTISTPSNPITIGHARSVRPSGIRVLTVPGYEELFLFRTDDSTIGTTILTFGSNVGPGIAILGFS